MTITIETIYDEYSAGSAGFAREVATWCGYESCPEVIMAIGEIAETAAEFDRIWAGPTADEFTKISARALEMSGGEPVFWGATEIA
jgi:hypothetical protein